MDLNWMDSVILVVVGFSLLIGLWRGLVREVLSLAALIAAVIIGRLYGPQLAPSFAGMTENAGAQYVLAFALLFVLTLIVGAIVNHFVARFIKLVGLRMVDRVLGAAFGVLRGLLVIGVIVFFASALFAEEDWWQSSVLLPHVVDLIEWSRLYLEGSDSAVQT